MQVTFDLEKMSLDEKLELVDKILGIVPFEEIEIPDWHEEILRQRDEKEAKGLAKYSDLDDVAERLRNRKK